MLYVNRCFSSSFAYSHFIPLSFVFSSFVGSFILSSLFCVLFLCITNPLLSKQTQPLNHDNHSIFAFQHPFFFFLFSNLSFFFSISVGNDNDITFVFYTSIAFIHSFIGFLIHSFHFVLFTHTHARTTN
ncbi:hypothetical protein C8Q75DRAFT_381948 [Abortiporus biennis]|nr:hypothetical protein C8Q75DRAFT_381948 [Abortiporus biennis]